VARQHGVVTRQQLLDLGLTSKAIEHRVSRGRLHPVAFGVYAVGRARLTQCGLWMAAVLSCGPGAALSHTSAGAHLGIVQPTRMIELSAPALRRRPGIIVHRRKDLAPHVMAHLGIPVTTPSCTLVDLAAQLPRGELEAAVNAADRLDLIAPEELRTALQDTGRRPGGRVLRGLLDRSTFTLTDSELERLFLPIARAAGLSLPRTGVVLHGHKVDFYWPELGLVVETDGLRYHRTPAQQAKDRLRDQVHTAAGLTTLRFTHAQVRYEPRHVQATLHAVGARLATG
jgi:very-short-patch-repair endonuclease